MILNLDDAPDDTLERLLWMSGVAEQVHTELDAAFAEAYFEARLERRIDAALSLNLHGRKRILAWTRGVNNARGRSVRWGDGLRE